MKEGKKPTFPPNIRFKGGKIIKEGEGMNEDTKLERLVRRMICAWGLLIILLAAGFCVFGVLVAGKLAMLLWAM